MSTKPGSETQALWQDFRRTRDQALRDRLILTYAPLVKFVAGRLGSGLPAHVDEGDLVSYGLLGLIGAIERDDLAESIDGLVDVPNDLIGTMITGQFPNGTVVE